MCLCPPPTTPTRSITYRLSSPGTSWNYWCDAITPADEAAETREFSELTAHLLGAFSGTGKTFILEHWEGDWSAHCGNYDASKPPTPEVQARMVRWLTARQAGVDAGRAAWCRSAGAAVRDCTDGRAVHGAAGAFVYHASEVNLIGTSMGAAPLRNNILGVIPFVRLDMVSYSSYDTQWLRGASPTSLALALDFIAAHHNATAAAPSPAVFIAEYGIAQVEDPDPVHVAALVANVNAAALSIGPSGARRAAYTFMWELFDNGKEEGWDMIVSFSYFPTLSGGVAYHCPAAQFKKPPSLPYLPWQRWTSRRSSRAGGATLARGHSSTPRACTASG